MSLGPINQTRRNTNDLNEYREFCIKDYFIRPLRPITIGTWQGRGCFPRHIERQTHHPRIS